MIEIDTPYYTLWLDDGMHYVANFTRYTVLTDAKAVARTFSRIGQRWHIAGKGKPISGIGEPLKKRGWQHKRRMGG